MTGARSIQASLSRWFAVQTLVGLSVVCAVIYCMTAWSFQVKQASEFERRVELVAHLLREPAADVDRADLQHKLDDFFLSHGDIGIVLARGGQTLYSANALPQQARQWRWTPTELKDIPAVGQTTQLRLGIDVQEDVQILRRLGWTLVGAVVLGSMLVALTGMLLVRRGLRPLKTLALQTAATGPAFPERRIDASAYASELVPSISQFNAVLERAEQAYQQLEAFNADVAHELRTPLANMIAEAEVELARPRTTQALRDALISNLEETRRLSAIVTDMLFLSKSDRGATARRSTPVSLSDQVHAVVEFHEAELEESGLKVQLTGEAHASIDVALVRRALSNLLSNAIRYATPGSVVDVELDTRDTSAWLRVRNRGDAIPPASLPHLFKRFYRAERSRSGSSEHHGLGLAIVAAIARMHGGQTCAQSQDGVTEVGFSVQAARTAGAMEG